MKFEEMPLRVPSAKKIEKKLEELTELLNETSSVKETLKVVKKYFKLLDDFETDTTIISIRNSVDTRDETYQKAYEEVCEVAPIIESYVQKFNKALVNNKFRNELEEILSPYYFKRIEDGFKCFDESIINELQEEAKLVNEYDTLMASAKIPYKGEVYNLSQIAKFLSDKDQKVRIESSKLYYGFLESIDEKVGEIYSKLVKLRNDMAIKLGFKNYIELGYLKLGRVDYNAEMVKGYRDQIYQDVVPVVKKLRQRQASRIGIKNPKFYDYNLDYNSGNATPKGNTPYLVECATKMYHDMSEESGKFFDFMVTNNLLDLDAKPGKQGGGYMTYMPRYKSPFIFSNSNGTSGDVDTLTHEVGHAFQAYLGSNIKVPDFRMPTLEACEIDSMSMEFFAWPYMELFFKDEANKYRFSHLDSAISFLPYGVEVDEFQHFVYENPNLTHKERCEKWKELDKKYRPWLDFDGFEFLENGHFWIKQSHIFGVPFYYIDYTLAQVLALEFKNEMEKNPAKAWKKYIKLLKMGGKYPFLTLIEKDKLLNPFVQGNVKKIIKPQIKVLDSFDDKNF